MGEAVRRLVAGDTPSVTMQHRLRKKDGGLAEVETVSSAVPGSPGEAPRVLRISRDITQRNRMGSRAAELTRQRLASSGQGKHRSELLSINRIVEEQVPVLRTALPPSVEVALGLAREVPPVLADVLQMKQVVMSLCLNAAEALPAGGA